MGHPEMYFVVSIPVSLPLVNLITRSLMPFSKQVSQLPVYGLPPEDDRKVLLLSSNSIF
jgi:hypothetical protein